MLSFLDSNSNIQGDESTDDLNQSVEQNASTRTSQNSTHIQEEVPSTSSSQNNTSIQEEVPSSRRYQRNTIFQET